MLQGKLLHMLLSGVFNGCCNAVLNKKNDWIFVYKSVVLGR